MTAPAQVLRLRDFSSGQMVSHAKRRDDIAAVRSACRQSTNTRVLPTGAVENRPGRSALFASNGRTDEVRMSPTATYRLCFGNGVLQIRTSAGTSVVTQSGYAWAPSTLDQIVWDVFGDDVVMCFPGQAPKVARWDGVTTWTFLDWAATVTGGGQKRVPYYRVTRKGITLAASAVSGSVTLTFSSGMALTSSWIGTRIRYLGRQITITAVASATSATGTINEPLPPGQTLTFASDPRTIFNIGDEIEGVTSGAKAIVVGSSATTLTVQLLRVDSSGATGNNGNNEGTAAGFSSGEVVRGPAGSLTLSAPAPSNIAPQAITIWDEEIFNTLRLYPRSVSVDQNRLIFTDFPAVPGGIAYSAVGDHNDFHVGANPADGFFEIAPKRARVYHVVPGADQFVFTDKGVLYVPISEGNPLQPGSVTFRTIPSAAASRVEPVSTAYGLVYVSENRDRVLAIVGTGQSAQPYLMRPVSDWHADLFNAIVCVDVEEGSGNPAVDHVYAVNGDGTVAVGRFDPGREWVGWVLWSGFGTVDWVSVLGTTVLFDTLYGATELCEQLDPDQYLDAAVPIENIPAALAAGGTGYFWLNSLTPDVTDGRSYLGTRAVAAGVITEQPDDDFTTAVIGFKWTMTLEPFLPHAAGGSSVKQTMRPRQIHDGAVTVENSTGFTVQGYRPNTGEWQDVHERSGYISTDNQDAEPPLREETVNFKMPGAAVDPRIRIVKATPGPLRILEIGVEIGV